jgi:nucleoside-diphosphate-sugar epimerase
VVAVSGAAGPFGSLVAGRLSRSSGVRKVIALDSVRGASPEVTWRVGEATDVATAKRLAGVDVVVHRVRLDADPAEELRAVETLLRACATAGVRRAVVISSASVYGAHPGNPVPLDEHAPLRAEPDGGTADLLLSVEELVVRSRVSFPALKITVLRPATVVGTGEPSVVSRHFAAPRMLVVRGSHPRWQFVHVDDLAAAVEVAALGEVEGEVTVGADGSLSQDEVEALSGRRRVELPSSLAERTAERLHRAGVTASPASELAYVSHPWVVPSTALRAAGWAPLWDNTACFELLLGEVTPSVGVSHRISGRLGVRLGGKEAALGATGATVALLGTAAVIRQIRRHRGVL